MRRSRLSAVTVVALSGALLTALVTTVATVAHGEPGAAVPAPADPASVPGYNSDPLSLLGSIRLTPQQMAAFVSRGHRPRTTVAIDDLARIFVQEGAALGVRADLAWAQSIVETGYFTFPDSGMVHPDDNNFAGIGACDSCANGNGYADARTGVRAQMQLLRGYADPETLAGAMIFPPRSYRGIAPTWWEMGNGHWATSTRYASSVIAVYGQMLQFAGIDFTAVPPPIDGSAVAGEGVAAEPQPRAGDGLYLADPNGQVYDVGDARFWGSLYEQHLRSTVVAIAALPHATGYRMFFSSGEVLAFGSAHDFGNAGRGVVAAVGAPHGDGYWTVDAHGNVAAFGSAASIAPAPGVVPDDARIVSLAPTRTGDGLWLVDSRGVVYAIGDARAFGNLDGATPQDPVVGLAPTPWDDGYWIATTTGRVVPFGAATEHGGLADEFAADADPREFVTAPQRSYAGLIEAARHLLVAIRPSPSGFGYWLVSADGLVVGRGDAPDLGQVETFGVPVLSATSRLDAAPPFRPDPR